MRESRAVEIEQLQAECPWWMADTLRFQILPQISSFSTFQHPKEEPTAST